MLNLTSSFKNLILLTYNNFCLIGYLKMINLIQSESQINYNLEIETSYHSWRLVDFSMICLRVRFVKDNTLKSLMKNLTSRILEKKDIDW